ncbi:carbohydrate ABC transporter membrane protein 1 (CUT1 family) [Kribbella rubisoli]|uniref:Carbohydrate ABC transporter membrane protein 1 (CUT1 family) n=1 Tax=Kribbella rubisoli TaxID=3075929 RepID=A0A4Q7XHE6_9ACTN|nr:sugar ABC transporter permease [Kribbella rubisoli]RZU22303.1 carbohydrate ABC transporter membrane protein 1 (CUT1 family) [Kribbella rubisoli]
MSVLAIGRTKARTRTVSRQTRKRRWIGLLFLSPALLLYGVIVLVPLLQTVNYSFYKWDGVSEPTWVGLRNYLEFGRDPRMYAAFGHVLVLILMFGLIPLGLGLISAALLSRAKIRGEGIYRWFLFLPQVLTSVVVAIIWKRIYAPDGPLNSLLRGVGLGHLTRNWLGDFTWALPSLGMIGVWGGFGFTMVLFLAGILAIPDELYEAARLDGSTRWQEFWLITLPSLRGQMAIALTLTITGALRTFDMVYITTQGGPGTATTTPALLLYQLAFVNPDVGRASATGVVLAVLCLGIAVGITRIMENKDR